MLLLGQNQEPVTIADVFAAKSRIRKFAPPTPLVSMEPLNIQLGAKVYLKLENTQPTGAYKFRGALNKIHCLIDEYGKDIKVITCSSGNHGMACAYAASAMGVDCKVFVPTVTPEIKKSCITALGAQIEVVGAKYDDSFIDACRVSEEEHRYYMHPVADRYVLGGQGTISTEILEQLETVDQIIVPIGGAGLIAGIGFAIKTLKPSVKVIGIMPEGSAVYVESRKAGKLVEIPNPASMCDAVLRVSGEPYLYPYVEQYADELHTVTEESIAKAVKLACLYGKVTLEGSGALALASIVEGKCKATDNTVLICSGGNIDQPLLERCLQAKL